MNLNIGKSPTGALPPLESPKGTFKTPSFSPAPELNIKVSTEESTEWSVRDQPFDPGTVTFHQGESLTEVPLFAEAEKRVFKSPAAAQGERALAAFQDRQGQAGRKSYGVLDYAFAKLSREGAGLTTQTLSRQLSTLMERLKGLDNPDAPPLSADEVVQLNASLKTIGLMTDGVQLYNLSNRMATEPGAKRQPQVCSTYEVQQIQNVCAALLEAPSESSELAVFGQNLSVFQDVIVEMEQNIAAAEVKVQGMIDQLHKVDQALDQSIQKAETLAVEFQVQTQEVQGIVETLDLMTEVDKPGKLNPEKVSVLNERLKPLALEVKLSSGGRPVFRHRGQEISSTQVKGLIRSRLSEKREILQNLALEMAQNHQNILRLQRQSRDLSSQMQVVIDKELKPALKQLAQTRQQGQHDLNALLDLKADPERWGRLSAQEQAQVDKMIAAYRQGMTRIDKSTQRGEKVMEQAESALAASQKIQDAATRILKDLAGLMQQNQKLLAHPALLALDQAAPLEAKAAELIHAANQLYVDLNLNTEGAASLIEQSLEWIRETEQLMLDALKQSAQDTVRAQSERLHLDRTLTLMRENMDYHQQQLDRIHDLK